MLKDSVDVPVRPYRRLSQVEDAVLRDTLEELWDKGRIQESSSQYSAQLLFVKKKDGKLRLCLDFRGLNNDNFLL